jgi:hypothetical protein
MKTLKNRDREEVKRAKTAIKNLKERGYKVYISHVRRYIVTASKLNLKKSMRLEYGVKLNVPVDFRDYMSNGGFTKVRIHRAGGIKVSHGMAACHPLDNFNRWTGISLALTQAMAHIPKSERKEIWGHSEVK